MTDTPQSANPSCRQRALVVLCTAGFVFLTGWALYHSFKREICGVVSRQVRGTQYERRGNTWVLRRIGEPIERDLAGGLIRSGDLVSDVAARYPPMRTETYGRYTYLVYYPHGSLPGGRSLHGGPQILAKDGVVVMASTYNWCPHLFFDSLSPSESKELFDLREAQFAACMAGRSAAEMAVVGPAATIDPRSLPRNDAEPEKH